MGLFDELKDLKEQLAEAEKNEIETPEEVVEEPIVEETVDEPPEEEKEPEVVEEVKPEPVKEELDDAGYARLRREAAAEKKRAAELEQEIHRLKSQPDEVPENHLEREFSEILQEKREREAQREFKRLENDFRAQVSDFDDVVNGYQQALFQSIRIQNPRLPQDEVADMMKKQILIRASNYVRAGFNPIEEMYEEAKSLGFKAAPKEEPKAEEKPEIKPDLDVLARNKQRSSGMAAAKGSGAQGALTREAAASMTNAEWSRLTTAEKKRVLAGG